jgi:hypothetical protein
VVEKEDRCEGLRRSWSRWRRSSGWGGGQRAMAMGRILEIHANLDADT